MDRGATSLVNSSVFDLQGGGKNPLKSWKCKLNSSNGFHVCVQEFSMYSMCYSTKKTRIKYLFAGLSPNKVITQRYGLVLG